MKKRRLIYGVLGIILLIFLCIEGKNKGWDYSKALSKDLTYNQPRATAKNARKMLSEQLRKDYGEEFEIGGFYKRSAAGKSFYQTTIVPLSKIGTEEEKEHTVEAYVDIERGRLIGSGDMYGLIAFEKNTEEYFQKILEEKFGKYVRAKTRARFHLVDRDNKGATYRTLGTTFEKSFENLKKNKEPKLEMYQAIYIFDKKLTPKLKEEYREKIWSYVEMLKEKGMYEYTMLEINFVDERILSNNFEELEKSMFSDLGEKEKNFYEYMVEYPTDKSRKNFVKEVSKGYKIMNEEEKLKNLHKFKMKERGELDEIGNFRDYYSNIKTYILSIYDEERKGGLIIKDFGAARKAKEIIYWNKKISVFDKGGRNE